MDRGRLRGKRALVTGAAGGQGKAVARAFAREGAAVAITDLASESLDDLAGELAEAGARVLACPADLRSEDEIADVAAAVESSVGALDVLYNNAGVYAAGRDAPVDSLSLDVWNDVIAINLTSVFLMSKHCLSLLRRGHRPSIVNVSSVAGYAGDARTSAYPASKAGVIALTKAMAAAYGPEGIRVNVLCPGPIETGMIADLGEDWRREIIAATALQRIGDPSEVAEVAVFLGSDESSYMTGSVIPVHGGLSR